MNPGNWLAAEDNGAEFIAGSMVKRRERDNFLQIPLWEELPDDDLPIPETAAREWDDELVGSDPELWIYRRRTIKVLRRYQRFSLETGRLPSLLGREFFRSAVSSYRSVTFEDRVIFVRDVEKVLERLDCWDQRLVARVVLQEHSYDRAAYLLHCSRKTIQRRMPEVLDLLSQDFLEVGLLIAVPD